MKSSFVVWFPAAALVACIAFTGCARKPRPEKLSKSEKVERLRQLIAERDGPVGGRAGQGPRGGFPERNVRTRKPTPPEPPDEPIDAESAPYLSYFNDPNPQKLIELLQHKNPAVRRRALERLASIDKPPIEAVPKAVELLDDEASRVRAKAAALLEKFGPDGSPGLKKLIELLRHHNDDVVESASKAIIAMGDLSESSIPEFIEILQDPDCADRGAVALVLGSHGPKARAAVPHLAPELESWSFTGNEFAEALGRIGAADELLAAIRSNKGSSRVNAAFGMGFLQPTPPKAIDALRSVSGDDDAALRQRVAESLGRVRPTTEAVVETLGRLTTDSENPVAWTAVEALGEIDPKLDSAVKHLIAATKSSEAIVRNNAVEALSKFSSSVRPRMLAALELLWENRFRAEEVLHKSPAESLPIILEVARDREQPLRLRMSAVWQLGDYAYRKGNDKKAEELQAEAERILNDEEESPDVRFAAALALEDMWEMSAAVAERILTTLETTGDVRFRRIAASRMTSIAGSDYANRHRRAVDALIAALDDSDKEVVAAACYSLPRFQSLSAIAIPKLCDLTAGAREKRNRESAATALGKIDPDGRRSVPVILDAVERSLNDENSGVSTGTGFAALTNVLERVQKDGSGDPQYAFDASRAVSVARKVLRDKDSFQRGRAADLLGRLGPVAADAVNDLANVIADDDFSQSSAVNALKAIGPKAKAAVPQLIRLAGDPSNENYSESIEALSAIKPPARQILPVLIEALKHGESHDAALNALVEYGPDAAPALPAAAKLLKSDNVSSQVNGIRLVAAVGPQAVELLPELQQAVEHEEAFVCKAALLAIGGMKVKAESAIPKVKSVLLDENRRLDVRVAAARALVDVAANKPEELKAVATLIAVADADSLSELFDGLGEQARPVLDAALNDSRPKARRNALKLLASRTPRDESERLLLAALKDEDSEVRKYAALELSRRGGRLREVVPVLLPLLRGDGEGEQWELLSPLFQAGPVATAGLVEAVLSEDVHWETRSGIVQELRYRDRRAMAGLPAIKKALTSDEETLRTLAAVLSAHPEHRSPESLHPSLIAGLDSKEAWVRSLAANALRLEVFLPHRDAIVPALVRTLSGEDRDVGENAATTLGQIPLRKDDLPRFQKVYDENPAARGAVLKALGRAWGNRKPLPEALPLFAAAFKDDDSNLQRVAANHILNFGRPGMELLLKSAASPQVDLKARESLLRVLGYNDGKLQSEDVAALTAMMKDEQDSISALAAAVLARGSHTSEEVWPLLAKGLRMDDYSTRSVCRNAVHKLGPKAAPLLPQLEVMMAELKSSSRETALRLLGYVAEDKGEAAATLISQFSLDDSDTSYVLVDALSELGRPAVPMLIGALENADKKTAVGCLKALEQIRPQPEKCSEAIEGLLEHGDAEVALAAASALAHINPKSAEPVPLLVRTLDSPNRQRRGTSLRALAVLGPLAAPAVPKLIELAGEKSDSYEALIPLRRIGPDGRAAIPLLMKELQERRHHYLAAEALASMGGEVRDRSPEFVALLKNEHLIFYATNVLKEVDPEAAVAELSRMLDDDYLKYRAVDALGRLGEQAAPVVPRLAAFLDGDDVEMRAAAVSALRNIGPPAKQAAPRLLKMLESPSATDRSAALSALGAVQSDAGETVKAVLQLGKQDPDDNVRRTAVGVVGVFKSEAGTVVPFLIERLDDKSLRTLAVMSLGRIGSKSKPAVEKLIELLKSEDGSLRFHCIRTLGEIGPDAAEAFPHLIKQLEMLTDRSNRSNAEAALWKIDPKAAQQAGVRKPDPEPPR